MLKSLNIDLAGDFLVMAATLMEIKSAMLLPRATPEQLQEDDLTDPRAELIRQLLEYKKFKDAANLLHAAADEHSQRFARPDAIMERLRPDAEPQLDIEQLSVWDLLEAFDAICRATGVGRDISHIKDDTPIDLYQIEVLHRLQTEGPMTFERIFESKSNRIVMIGLFLALLELIREKLVWAEPAKGGPSSSQIYLRALTEKSAEQAVQQAIVAIAEIDSFASAQIKQRKKPPISITELSSKNKPAVSLDKQQKEEMESSREDKQQTSN